MDFKILYEDENLKVLDKPAGINADDIPMRVHRLDKDTSGVLLVAKNDEALNFLQQQFSASAKGFGGQAAKKKYLALVVGHLKDEERTIETLLGRSPADRRKQKVFLLQDPQASGKRTAITKYRVLQKFKNYDLIEVEPLTGRKHQIRVHMAYSGHPIAGDKLYGFKGQITPEGLNRQFLHAAYLRIKMPDALPAGRQGKIKEFNSNLPEDLNLCLKKLKPLI